MRTTLTLDDDVAAALEQLRKNSGSGLKELVNDALRRGLKDMSTRPMRIQSFRTKSVALGKVRLPSIDNIGEALALAQAE
jgi:Ribbon-helix-helix protein, copG family